MNSVITTHGLDRLDTKQPSHQSAPVDLKPCRHFVGLGEQLISSDIGAALDGFKMEILISSARTLMKMGGQEVPIEFVHDIVALQFRKKEFDVNNFLHFSRRSTILRRLWLMEYGLPFSIKRKN
ncbi:unnamed protein product [Brassica napus]|nr:unnamed protein product [Brassica napus]